MSILARSELSSLVEVAGSLAREVGSTIRARREQGVDVAATKSSRTDVVTEADREAERLLAEGIRAARPNDGMLGEEGASVTGTSGITWVVDPIDGTVNYLYGLPAYAVSVAATVEDRGPGATADGRRAVAGAVYVPVTDELYTATEGGGAQLNGRAVRVSGETDLAVALVATGFGYTEERRTEQAEVVRQLIPRVRDIRRMGAASVDLCLLASGRLDAYYERGLQPWDYAAGARIARESGAEILALHDDALPGEPMMIAGPPSLARSLQLALRDAYDALM
jgi:myo-inositol-1(or 4)-monophosphatase